MTFLSFIYRCARNKCSEDLKYQGSVLNSGVRMQKLSMSHADGVGELKGLKRCFSFTAGACNDVKL